MSIIRRITALALASVVIGAFMSVVPAGAQQTETIVTAPEAFVASASARGLAISLLNNPITVGVSGALIDSSPKAQGQGAGVLLSPGTVANALVTTSGGSQTPPAACLLNLPLLGLLTVLTACGQAQATIPNGLPQAGGAGSVAAIDIGGSLLTPLIDQVGALVGQTVGAVITPLTTLLGGLLNPLLGSLNLDLNSTVQQLLDGLKRATGLLSIRLGSSTAQATTTAAKVNATAIAQGGTIEVLPGLSALGAPLATIVVGDAKASVDVTRPAANQGGQAAAVATPSFDAALVRVKLGIPLLGNITDIPISLGAPLTLLAGTPLESTISIGGGSTADGPNGTKVAVADGVSVQLLKGLSGGVAIQLAHAEASGGGVSAALSVRQINNPVPVQPELPRTGGEAWLPMMGALLLLAAYGTRRLASSRRA
jgi:hypothetical protein